MTNKWKLINSYHDSKFQESDPFPILSLNRLEYPKRHTVCVSAMCEWSSLIVPRWRNEFVEYGRHVFIHFHKLILYSIQAFRGTWDVANKSWACYNTPLHIPVSSQCDCLHHGQSLHRPSTMSTYSSYPSPARVSTHKQGQRHLLC